MNKQALALLTLASFTLSGCHCDCDGGGERDTPSSSAAGGEASDTGGDASDAGGGGGGGQHATKSLPCPSETMRSSPASLCPPERQIVVRPPEGCPDLVSEGWVSEVRGAHCLYIHVGADVAASFANAPEQVDLRTAEHAPLGAGDAPLAKLLPGATISSDCVLLPSAPPPASLLEGRKTMAETFATRLAVRSDSPAPTSPVRVAVIDTAPRHDRSSARGLHGRLMASIVEHVAGATTEVFTYPGLPRDRDGHADLDAGGYYGYQSDLARAIDDALREWEEGGGQGKLVVNLSVGWAPELSGANTTLVAESLARARCKGALILAAVGNRHPRACANGPTGPAFYVGYDAPSEDECKGDVVTPRLASAPGRPLVHPVTPVDHQGRPLDVSRANAALGSLGLDAVVQVDGTYLGPMSGSSVATAVMSGMAARAWSSAPDLSADALVAQLYETGSSHGTSVDPSATHGGLGQQRVVGLAGVATSPTAPAPATLTAPASEPKPIALAETTTCNACELEETVHWPAGMTDFHDAISSAWVVPQPDDVLCPTCTIDELELSLAISSAYATMTVADVRVTFWSNARKTETLHFGPQRVPTEGASPLVLTNAELCTVDADASVPTAAYVEFVFETRDASGNTQYYAVGNSIRASGQACAL